MCNILDNLGFFSDNCMPVRDNPAVLSLTCKSCMLMQAYRESTGTVSCSHGEIADPVAAAEEIAFCRACARFGLGLYLYHEE